MHEIDSRRKRESALRQADIKCISLNNLRLLAVKRVAKQHRLLEVRADQSPAKHAADRQYKDNDACAFQTGQSDIQYAFYSARTIHFGRFIERRINTGQRRKENDRPPARFFPDRGRNRQPSERVGIR